MIMGKSYFDIFKIKYISTSFVVNTRKSAKSAKPDAEINLIWNYALPKLLEGYQILSPNTSNCENNKDVPMGTSYLTNFFTFWV